LHFKQICYQKIKKSIFDRCFPIVSELLPNYRCVCKKNLFILVDCIVFLYVIYSKYRCTISMRTRDDLRPTFLIALFAELISVERNGLDPSRLLKRFGSLSLSLSLCLSYFRYAIFSRRDDQADSVTGQFNLFVVIITS